MADIVQTLSQDVLRTRVNLNNAAALVKMKEFQNIGF